MEFLNFLALVDAQNEPSIASVRNWFWLRTERVRWRTVLPGEDWASLASDAAVRAVVVDLASATKLTTWSVAKNARQPVIVIDSNPSPEDELSRKYPAIVRLAGDWLGSDVAQARLERLLDELGARLPPWFEPRFERNDHGLMRTLRDLTALEYESSHHRAELAGWLKLAIAKYFGTGRSIRLSPVRGGWSGAPVLEASVSGDIYYLKFLASCEDLASECESYQRARDKWLGNNAVEVHFVEGLLPTAASLCEAFPIGSVMFPLCLRSASDVGTERITFHRLYHDGNFEKSHKVLEGILQALSQPSSTPEAVPPLHNPGHRFELTSDPDRRSILLDTLHDLQTALRQLCPAWHSRDGRDKLLRDFFTEKSPLWLSSGTTVLRGHVHGDLNTRNCLCSREDPTSIRFIDLGRYRPDGFLVHDLAMLEASLKWGAMGTEHRPGYRFGDLDTLLLRHAKKVEEVSVAKGIGFSQRDLLAALPPARRNARNALLDAYSLVTLIRTRAGELSGSGDPHAKHYFAALLGWNLLWLKDPHVRRIKKVLALYSSALILEKFNSLETVTSATPVKRKSHLAGVGGGAAPQGDR